jgi:hypothetical protein
LPQQPEVDYNPMLSDSENPIKSPKLDQSMNANKKQFLTIASRKKSTENSLNASSGTKFRRTPTFLEKESIFSDYNEQKKASQNMK